MQLKAIIPCSKTFWPKSLAAAAAEKMQNASLSEALTQQESNLCSRGLTSLEIGGERVTRVQSIYCARGKGEVDNYVERTAGRASHIEKPAIPEVTEGKAFSAPRKEPPDPSLSNNETSQKALVNSSINRAPTHPLLTLFEIFGLDCWCGRRTGRHPTHCNVRCKPPKS